MAGLPGSESARDPYVPLGWDRIALWATTPRRITCEVRLRGDFGERDGAELPATIVADLWLSDPAGTVFGMVEGLLLKRTTRAAMLGAAGVDALLYEVAWREVALPALGGIASPARMAAVEPARPALAEAAGYDPVAQARLESLLAQASAAHALAGLADSAGPRWPGRASRSRRCARSWGCGPSMAGCSRDCSACWPKPVCSKRPHRPTTARRAGRCVRRRAVDVASVAAQATREGHDEAIAWVVRAAARRSPMCCAGRPRRSG